MGVKVEGVGVNEAENVSPEGVSEGVAGVAVNVSMVVTVTEQVPVGFVVVRVVRVRVVLGVPGEQEGVDSEKERETEGGDWVGLRAAVRVETVCDRLRVDVVVAARVIDCDGVVECVDGE